MSTQVLGKVSCSPKGAWNNTTNYEYLDIVTNDNCAYIGKVQTIPAGTLPTNTSYWQLIASKGDKGDDGVGVDNIEFSLVSTSGLTATYSMTVTYTNGDTDEDTFTITNGNGIASIEKTGTLNLVDTYTIEMDNGDTTTFTVTNAKSIESITKVNTSVLTDTYQITFNDGTSQTYAVVNGNGIESIEKTSTADLVDTYTITYDNGDTTTFNVTNGAKGDKGDPGNVMYATFDIDLDTGILSMKYDAGYYGASFSINEHGELEVSLS